MNIKKSFLKAILLLLFLTVLYYLFYAFNENRLSNYCNSFICFEILSLAEFLGLLTAWISLFFVVSSLESWKNAYKFQRAKLSIENFSELLLISNRYFMYLNKLSNTIQRKKESELIGSFYFEEEEFNENIAELDVAYHQIQLQMWLDQDRNIKYYDDFKTLLSQFSMMIFNIEQAVSHAHLSESNYGDQYATENDLERRKKSVGKIKDAVARFKLDKEAFQKNFDELHNKLNQ